MKARYGSRKAVECKVSLASDGLLGQGRVLDLSVPGCLLETGLRLRVGQSLRLRLLFPGGHAFGVSLAVVRWTKGTKAGVEFIRMSETDQARLRWHVGFAAKPRSSAWSEPVMLTGVSEG